MTDHMNLDREMRDLERCAIFVAIVLAAFGLWLAWEVLTWAY